jgi:hypothetical protein
MADNNDNDNTNDNAGVLYPNYEDDEGKKY